LLSGTSKSNTYKEAANTIFDFKREYARFAALSIVAHQSFNALDADKSGYITRQDLFAALKSVFQGATTVDKNGDIVKMKEEDMKLLTEFVTREADNSTSKEDQLQQVGDGRVSLSEWVNIVTTDTTCYETLIQVLQNMGSDEREKLLNRFGGSLMQKELENAKIIDERAAIV